MKIFLSSFLIILFLSLSFSGVLFFENNKIFKSLLVNSASADENEENLASDDVKPWEAYRGWAPSVPYGKSYISKNEPESTKKVMSDEKPLSIKKEKEIKMTGPEEDSTKKEDHIKPWEAYRGWAPSIPYGQ